MTQCYEKTTFKDRDTRQLLLTGQKSNLLLISLTYHSGLDDEPTDTIVSLKFLWFLSNVANSVETKVLHKTTPISSTTIY